VPTRHPPRTAALWAVLALASPGPVGADPADELDMSRIDDPANALLDQPRDYDLGSDEWNGLGTLVRLAKGDGFDVRATDVLNWDSVRANDILVVLYPTEEVDATHLNAFVRNGGRLILGDDYGRGAKALSRLGLVRDAGVGVGARKYHDDLPFAPVALPRTAEHPLARGVDGLLTNHPAVLTPGAADQDVFGFAAAEAVVVAGQRGAGSFVALSDPSVLINNMLLHPGNFQFAINLLRYFAEPDRSGRLILLIGEFHVRGAPSNYLDDGTLNGSFRGRLLDFNRWLDGLNDWLLDPAAMRILAVAGALLLVLLAIALLPLRSAADVDGSWLRARPFASATSTAAPALIARVEAGAEIDDYTAPLALVRATFWHRLADLLGDDAVAELPEPQLLGRVEIRAGAGARRAAASVLSALRVLGDPEKTDPGWQPVRVSRAQFEQAHSLAQALYRNLDGGAQSER
jgi:hypothetical protein